MVFWLTVNCWHNIVADMCPQGRDMDYRCHSSTLKQSYNTRTFLLVVQVILAIHNLLFLLKFQLQSAFVRNSLHSRFSSRQWGVLPCLVHLVRAVLVSWRKIYWVRDNCIRITFDSNHRWSDPSDALSLLRMGSADPEPTCFLILCCSVLQFDLISPVA